MQKLQTHTSLSSKLDMCISFRSWFSCSCTVDALHSAFDSFFIFSLFVCDKVSSVSDWWEHTSHIIMWPDSHTAAQVVTMSETQIFAFERYSWISSENCEEKNIFLVSVLIFYLKKWEQINVFYQNIRLLFWRISLYCMLAYSKYLNVYRKSEIWSNFPSKTFKITKKKCHFNIGGKQLWSYFKSWLYFEGSPVTSPTCSTAIKGKRSNPLYFCASCE